MERIWICDQKKSEIRELSGILKTLTSAEIQKFTGSEELKKHCATHASEVFVIFMDENFCEQGGGLQMANEVLVEYPDADIIFLSEQADLCVQEAMLECPGAKGCIGKPFDKNIISRYIGKIKREKAAKKRLLIRQKGQNVLLKEKAIRYLESNDHRVTIHTVYGDYQIYEKLCEVEARLSEEFIACHKSFLVNLNHVVDNGNGYLFLSDGTEIPISRPNRKKSRDLFYEHLRRRVVQSV